MYTVQIKFTLSFSEIYFASFPYMEMHKHGERTNGQTERTTARRARCQQDFRRPPELWILIQFIFINESQISLFDLSRNNRLRTPANNKTESNIKI